MDKRIALLAMPALVLSVALLPARAEFRTVTACDEPVELTLRQDAYRNLSWTVCGEGGELGDAAAAWDTASEPYSVKLHDEIKAEEQRASGARALRRGSALDVSLELDSGSGRKPLAIQGLAIGAAPRAVPGVAGATLEARRQDGALLRLAIFDEPVDAIARRIAATAAVRIDGIERLRATPITLNLRVVPVRAVLPILASEGGVLLLQAHPDRYAFSMATEAKVFNDALAAVDPLRNGEDREALEAALARLVAAAPVPPEGPVLDITSELDELARLHAAREDYASAEKLQRQRLAIEERVEGTRVTRSALDALDQIGTLRGLQGDEAGATAAHREVVALSEGFADRDDSVFAHSLGELGLAAMMARDDVAAERWFARASPLLMGLEPDSLDALRMENILAAHAFALERLDRPGEALPLHERRVVIMRAQFGRVDAMTASAMEDLAYALVRDDQLPRAADLYGEARIIRARSESATERSEQQATELMTAVATLGEFAQREQQPGDVEKLRARLAAYPPSKELLFRMSMLLERRADRQRGTPALTVTCDALAEVVAARARAEAGTRPEIVARMAEMERNSCLKGS